MCAVYNWQAGGGITARMKDLLSSNDVEWTMHPRVRTADPIMVCVCWTWWESKYIDSFFTICLSSNKFTDECPVAAGCCCWWCWSCSEAIDCGWCEFCCAAAVADRESRMWAYSAGVSTPVFDARRLTTFWLPTNTLSHRMTCIGKLQSPHTLEKWRTL